jgi:hypothetical protein
LLGAPFLNTSVQQAQYFLGALGEAGGIESFDPFRGLQDPARTSHRV